MWQQHLKLGGCEQSKLDEARVEFDRLMELRRDAVVAEKVRHVQVPVELPDAGPRRDTAWVYDGASREHSNPMQPALDQCARLDETQPERRDVRQEPKEQEDWEEPESVHDRLHRIRQVLNVIKPSRRAIVLVAVGAIGMQQRDK